MNGVGFLKLSVLADVGQGLPTEARLFHFGVNESSKGPAIFDDEAARLVMAAFETDGTDLMIDLEHDSLNPDVRKHRADAADARGWGRLEVRADGLWLADIRWAPDGEERLLSKKQRYFSPAFRIDPATKRVKTVLNVALTAMPCTYHAEPLVAASKLAGAVPVEKWSTSMDPTQVKAALDAIEGGDSAKALEILKTLIASAAGGEVAPEAPETTEALAECAEPKPPTDEQKLLSRLATLVGRTAPAEIEAEVVRLSKVVESLEADRVRAEQASRVELVGELVKLGAELPATAWADADKRIPAARFMGEPIAELRSRVDAFRAAGRNVGKVVEAPTVTLSRHEAELAANMNPTQRKRFEDLRASRKVR